MQNSSVDADGHVQGICPDGWYLPTAAYFEQLKAKYSADDLRSATGWINVVGNNSTGFSWNASGIYNGNTSRFEELLSGGYLWAVEMVIGTPVLTIYEMPCHCDYFFRLDNPVNICASVRCVKEVDNPTPEPEPETFTCGTSKMIDSSGNKYETVQIGELCWTKTNLRTTKYRDGSTISNQIGTTTPAYYRLSETDKSTDSIVKLATVPDSVFGFYYNGYATISDNLCPAGWHVPDTNDWKDLIGYLKARPEYWCDNDNSNLAKAVASRNFWFNVETPPITYTINHDPVARPCSPQYQGPDYLNDASYFSAIPAGAWYDNLGGNMDTLSGLGGREFDPGKDAHFWSSSTQPGSDSTGYFFRLGIVTYDVVALAYDALKYGRSVRCLRDEPATNSMGATSVTKPSDTLLGMMTTSDDEPIATQDFEWQDSYVTMMFKLCGKILTSRNASIITGSPSMFTTPGAGRSTVMVFACTSVR